MGFYMMCSSCRVDVYIVKTGWGAEEEEDGAEDNYVCIAVGRIEEMSDVAMMSLLYQLQL